MTSLTNEETLELREALRYVATDVVIADVVDDVVSDVVTEDVVEYESDNVSVF